MGYRRQMAWSLVWVTGTLVLGTTVVIGAGGEWFFLVTSTGPALVVLLAGLSAGIHRPCAFRTCFGWGVLSYLLLLLALGTIIPGICHHLCGPLEQHPLISGSWGIFPMIAVHLLSFSWPAPILQIVAGAMVAWFWQQGRWRESVRPRDPNSPRGARAHH